MSAERLKHIKETLMCAVESQMYNLAEVDAEELGEVVDMIKDIEEALYYCSVVEAMEEGSERKEKKEEMYYTPMHYSNGNQMYYSDRGGNQSQYSNGMRSSQMQYSNGRGQGNHASGMERNSTDGRDGARSYYSNGSSGGNMSGHSSGGGGNSSSQYTEREFPHAFQDEREGKSYRSRRMYMEAKETHQDKMTQMKELEKYAQELTQDIVEMIQEASPEEKQYLSKKIAALANKIN